MQIHHAAEGNAQFCASALSVKGRRHHRDAVTVRVEPAVGVQPHALHLNRHITLTGAVLVGGIGLAANARIPISSPGSSAKSRTQPLITTPAQPFLTAKAPRCPPNKARSSDAPQSSGRQQPGP